MSSDQATHNCACKNTTSLESTSWLSTILFFAFWPSRHSSSWWQLWCTADQPPWQWGLGAHLASPHPQLDKVRPSSLQPEARCCLPLISCETCPCEMAGLCWEQWPSCCVKHLQPASLSPWILCRSCTETSVQCLQQKVTRIAHKRITGQGTGTETNLFSGS